MFECEGVCFYVFENLFLLHVQLTTWFMGLQDLTPRSNITLSRGQLLWRRASMKVYFYFW